MPVRRQHFEQLATPESWISPLAVIAHIDLDAFYAQCLTVHYKIDPTEPLGCRQWNSLIAINYPARKFGLKRGVSVKEAKETCPGIHLPHVATFRKGEDTWDFHDAPDPANYKVSLDPFRRESRRIFNVFKRHFHKIEKAGTDEGFVDLGLEVYNEVLRRNNNILNDDEDTVDIEYHQLLDIGGDLVQRTRADIFEELHYTCSAGIAPNKLLAKLGSSYNKPNNQTVVYPESISKFLANFNITDAWGWGGKQGKEALKSLKMGNDVQNQCEYVRDKFSLEDLEKRLGGDIKLAKRLYDMVRGLHISEVTPRTLTKSMVAVKNFSGSQPIATREDFDAWLKVFAADISGRIGDMQEDIDRIVGAKTISVKYQTDNSVLSKQHSFHFNGRDIHRFQREVFTQSQAIAKNLVPLPCRYLVVEVAGIFAMPRASINFQSINFQTRNSPVISKEPKESDLQEQTTAPHLSEDDEPLFVDESEYAKEGFERETDGHKATPATRTTSKCSKCESEIPDDQIDEHNDWHFAKDLQKNQYTSVGRILPQSPVKRRKGQKDKTRKRDLAQQSILQFFKK